MILTVAKLYMCTISPTLPCIVA